MPTPESDIVLEVFPWSKNFETGIPKIDEQHKVLVQLLNKLASTLTENKQIKINEAFDELAAYADYHFASEEAIWRDHFKDDSWFTSHQSTHASFLPKVLALKAKDTNRPLPEIIEDIIRFLIRWLAFHIIDDDKRLALVVTEMEKGKSIEEAKAAANHIIGDSVHTLIETIMEMYDNLSSRTLALVRERNARLKVEAKLREANEELALLSITDQLTGLYNRRHFEEVFDNELKRIKRESNRFMFLILFDLDSFKSLNDNYGHTAGDEALKQIADCMRQACQRPTDFGFRLGGEEFGMLTTDDHISSGLEFAEIIRSSIEALQIPNKNSRSGDILTASLGLVSINQKDGHAGTLDEYMKIVDARMYAAKDKGGNCIVSSDEQN